MTVIAVHKWIIILFMCLRTANSQFPLGGFVPGLPVPYPGVVHMVPGPPQPVPVPVPMPVPVGVPIPVQDTTTTTTCRPHTIAKEDDSEPPVIKIYVPWPPYQFPNLPPLPNISIGPFDQNFTFNLPPQMPYRLVPPVFPMPLPMPAPPPLVMIPIPPMIGWKRRQSKSRHRKDSSNSDSSISDSDSDDSDSSSSSNSDKSKNRRKKNKKKYGIYRSNRRFMEIDSSKEEIKPILTYQSENGDIKLEKRLNMHEAALLMADAPKSAKNVKVMAGSDFNGKPRVMVIAKGAKANIQRKSPVVSKNPSEGTMGGQKQLVFKVPNNKTISNLTVSFNINR